MITEEQSKKILEEVMTERKWREIVQPNEFYAKQLERDWGKTRMEITTLLGKWKSRKLVTVRPARTVEGKSVNAYCFVDGVDIAELMKE